MRQRFEGAWKAMDEARAISRRLRFGVAASALFPSPFGGMRTPQAGEPPNWLVYFATDDADGSMAKVEELGGNKLAGPFDLPMGRIAIAQDLQGAAFALYAGDLAP